MKKKHIGLITVGILVLCNGYLWTQVFDISGSQYLAVDILDVGQGDAAFVETPEHHQILIDGGPGIKVLEKLGSRMPFFDRSIDVVILTHPDQDHVMGLLHVLSRYKVDYIVWTGMVRDGANYQKWKSLLADQEKRGSNIIIASSGMTIRAGEAFFEILHPFENIEGRKFSDNYNDTGIVAKLKYGKKSFLFTADVSSEVENRLLERKVTVGTDVLKIGHHGSKYSTSKTFLQAVHPSLAAISVGGSNAYGHPTDEVLQKLGEFGIRTLRTDRDGDIEFKTDGLVIAVSYK